MNFTYDIRILNYTIYIYIEHLHLWLARCFALIFCVDMSRYVAREQRYVDKKGIAVTCTTRHADDTLIPLAILALEYPCPFFTVGEYGAEFAQESP